jgi:hypothetical protein
MHTQSSARNFWLLSLRWVTRILGILLAAFICLFSFDVFGQGTGFWKTLSAFLIHNIPTFILIVILVLSWQWSWLGGAGLIIMGILYFIWSSEKSDFYLIIGLPVIIIGILFMLDCFPGKDLRKAREE